MVKSFEASLVSLDTDSIPLSVSNCDNEKCPLGGKNTTNSYSFYIIIFLYPLDDTVNNN